MRIVPLRNGKRVPGSKTHFVEQFGLDTTTGVRSRMTFCGRCWYSDESQLITPGNVTCLRCREAMREKIEKLQTALACGEKE